jgi:hypothetical protein
MFRTEPVDEIKTTYFTLLNLFSENCEVYEIMKNMVEPDEPQMTV